MWSNTKYKMDNMMSAGRIRINNKGMPEYIRYLDEMPGVPLQDIWDDIPPVNSQAQERLGYPTQKPTALLEKVIKARSNETDIILDPFYGCGTAISAAQRLNRQWIGIDITHIAISLIKTRLLDTYGTDITKTYKVIGEPTTLPDAEALATQDKYQFQWWALGLVGARPVEQKKGADQGIDGRLYFHDGDPTGKTKQIIFSVKGGHTDVKDMRDLGHVVNREGAEIGVLITLQEPTRQMNTEATTLGYYKSPGYGSHPRLQILTIAQLLNGKRIDMPAITGSNITFRKAPKASKASTVSEVPLPGIETTILDDEDIDIEDELDEDES